MQAGIIIVITIFVFSIIACLIYHPKVKKFVLRIGGSSLEVTKDTSSTKPESRIHKK